MTKKVRVAFITVDLQNDFIDRQIISPKAPLLIQRTNQAIVKADELSWDIIHCRSKVKKKSADWPHHWQKNPTPKCIEHTPGFDFPKTLNTKIKHKLFYKKYYDIFEDKKLEHYLKQKKITDIIFCGLYEHACVFISCVSAYSKGFKVHLASDLVGTNNQNFSRESRKWLKKRIHSYLPLSKIQKKLLIYG